MDYILKRFQVWNPNELVYFTVVMPSYRLSRSNSALIVISKHVFSLLTLHTLSINQTMNTIQAKRAAVVRTQTQSCHGYGTSLVKISQTEGQSMEAERAERLGRPEKGQELSVQLKKNLRLFCFYLFVLILNALFFRLDDSRCAILAKTLLSAQSVTWFATQPRRFPSTEKTTQMNINQIYPRKFECYCYNVLPTLQYVCAITIKYVFNR